MIFLFIQENFKTAIGVFLIIVSYPFGWVGVGFFSKRASKTGKKIFYFIGVAAYVISWLLLIFGVFLCGHELGDEIIAYLKTPMLVLSIVAVVGGIVWFLRKKIRR